MIFWVRVSEFTDKRSAEGPPSDAQTISATNPNIRLIGMAYPQHVHNRSRDFCTENCVPNSYTLCISFESVALVIWLKWIWNLLRCLGSSNSIDPTSSSIVTSTTLYRYVGYESRWLVITLQLKFYLKTEHTDPTFLRSIFLRGHKPGIFRRSMVPIHIKSALDCQPYPEPQ